MTARTWCRGRSAIAGAIGVTLALAACSGGSSSGEQAATPVDCSVFAAYGSYSGKTVNIFASIRDIEAKRFENSFKDFERCTGIKIKWEGSGAFEEQLVVRARGGTAPDLAPIPQPGLLQEMARAGYAKPADAKVKKAAEENYTKDWLAYGNVDGKFYAPPLGANVKSFVWYSPTTFKEKGWTVPETWAQMMDLTEEIAATGIKPWCAGFESGSSGTGWPGTDWIEDVLLRSAGPEFYTKWAEHKVPFNDPKVVEAFETTGKILLNPRYVNGGYGDGDTFDDSVKSIASTPFQDAGYPIVSEDCAMMRQASFYANQWATLDEKLRVGSDKDVYAFYLPPIKTGQARPVLGAGEFLTAFNTKEETKAVQLYMQSEEWVNKKAKLGDWLAPNKKLNPPNVSNPVDRLSLQLLQDATVVFRFDASDSMPKAVGTGSFWKGMIDWVTGKPTAKVVSEIEASWPKS
jgi:alpha-glucoside transport system substrate-binding protein